MSDPIEQDSRDTPHIGGGSHPHPVSKPTLWRTAERRRGAHEIARTFRGYFRRVLETPPIRPGSEKIEPNLFNGFDLRQSDGKLVRCERKASGETECRVVQNGRGN